MPEAIKAVVWFSEVTKEDVPLVGGKGANLGEMTNAKIPVPPGFIVTSSAYFDFLRQTNLIDKIRGPLESIDVNDSKKLQETAAEVRQLISQAAMPPEIADEIKRAYELGEVGLHEGVQLNVRDEVIKTTVGRAIFNDILKGKLPFVNETLDADRIFELVEMMYREHGEEEAVALLDRLKGLGFKFATRSGISISDLRPETSDFRLSSLKSLVSSLMSHVSRLTSHVYYHIYICFNAHLHLTNFT